MKIQNIFIKGIVDKDNDERIVANGTIVDAENCTSLTTEGSNFGVLKNIPGNVKKTSYNIPGGKTVGKGVNPSKNKVYNFIKGNQHDYIIEHDVKTNTSEIVLQSTTGTRLNLREGERVLNVDIVPSGEGNGEIMIFSGDSNPPRALNIERAKTWGVDGFTAEEIMLIKAPPKFPPLVTETTSSENTQSNNLQDKFISFGYRYKYKDGYYSVVSSWTKYIFVPGFFRLDFETFENLGMLSVRNGANIQFNTGPREVEAVELVFKYSNSSSIFRIETFIKSEEGWANNTNQTIQFNNSKIYSVLPESEYFGSFDNVPHKAVAQALIGSRVAFGNYEEDYDLIDADGNPVVMDYSLELISNLVTVSVLEVDSLDETFEYEEDPVIVEDAAIKISFEDINLNSGSSIFINFKIKSTQELEFDFLYSFILDRDYVDLEDLFLNSTFLNSIQVEFFEFFENNGGISQPNDGIVGNEVVENGFVVTYDLVEEIIKIVLPVIKYEIDQDPDPNTFVWDYWSNNQTSANFQNIAVNTSLKSRRSYEVCMIYRDLQCRKTTALTSTNNTLFIPNDRATSQNQIKVTIPLTQKPPVWADTYKFGIKVNKEIYQEIMASVFFVDGTYRWIKLDGENKNKAKEGDILIVKKDANGTLPEVVRVKILEIKEQPKDFLENNTDLNGQDIIEPAGLYMKIKPVNFEIAYDPDEFLNYTDYKTRKSGRPVIYLGGLDKFDGTNFVPIPLGQGSTISLRLHNFESDGDQSLYEREFVVQNDYAGFEDWFNAEVTLPLSAIGSGGDFSNITFVRGSTDNAFGLFVPNPLGDLYMRVEGTLSGARFERSKFSGQLNIRNVDGFYIFETDPKEAENQFFFETPEVYNVVNGEHEFQDHILTQAFNCYCFGNGSEGYQIRSAFNERYLNIDFCPTLVGEDVYRRMKRFADITYSGTFNEDSNLNALNRFNLALANFKADLDKFYGPIMKMKSQDTNLEIYQEDKPSKVMYGKDILFNADGTSNLARIEDVLGQQVMDGGEYGISFNPDSFDEYGFNSYFTDIKRGVVLKKNFNNGLFEISSQGMTNYFRKLFRENEIIQIHGKYDQFHDHYLLNIQYRDKNDVLNFVTWAYSDKDNGWLMKELFNPEDMVRINNDFVSFKNGEIYLHNQEFDDLGNDNYNTFYGIRYPSKVRFNLSQEPSIRKNFKTLFIEGSDPWKINCATDLDVGYIQQNQFEKKEGVFYAYIRTLNDTLDTQLNSVQGIGNCTIASNVLNFAFELPSEISIGDVIRNTALQIVGTVTNKTNNSLTLNSVSNLSSGDYVLSTKPQSVENNSLTGYYMLVDMEIDKASKTEVFSVGSEINQSHM
jgi:hypothetical protein